jgi:antitoxin component YwqK of YwqJK toxin-antitoxin module
MNKIKLEYICEYYENGQLRYEEYYLNDKRHNPNGPAYRRWYENGQLWYEGYYLNGKELTKEQFEDKMNKPSCSGRTVVIDGVEYKLTPLEK